MSKILTVVVVVYGDYDHLDRLLDDQVQCPDVFWVVVDNTPEPLFRAGMSDAMVRLDVSRIVPESGNAGYFGGAHLAVKNIPDVSSSKYVAICNADVRFSSAGVIARLLELEVRGGAAFSNVGAIAPQLVDGHGREVRQPHYVRRPPVEKMRRLARLYQHYPLAVIHRLGADLKRRILVNRRNHVPRHIFAPHGAFFILPARYFQVTKGLRYPSFLFGEEVHVGRECENAGLACIYEDSIVYSHANHGSIGSLPSRRIVGYLRDGHLTAAALLSPTDGVVHD